MLSISARLKVIILRVDCAVLEEDEGNSWYSAGPEAAADDELGRDGRDVGGSTQGLTRPVRSNNSFLELISQHKQALNNKDLYKINVKLQETTNSVVPRE
jgi:hypothetical protein